MKNLKLGLISAFILLLPLSLTFADDRNKKDQMISDLDNIKGTFTIKYAPADWKKNYADWDIISQIEHAKIQVEEKQNITVKDFQRILKEFFNSTRDYHVGVQFFSTEFAVLPFRIHSAQGKYYIAWVYPKALPQGVKIDKGDEILMFNDMPIAEAVAQLQKQEMGNPDSLTDHALAECFLTMRMGIKGDLVPQGPVKITVRQRGTTKSTTYEMEWLYRAEEIQDRVKYSSPRSALMNNALKSFKKKTLNQEPFFNKDMSAPVYRHLKSGNEERLKLITKGPSADSRTADDEEDDAPPDTFIGDEKSFLPALGRLVWQAPEKLNMNAYIYKTEQGRSVGYIRIPHYSGAEATAKNFAEIIQTFQAKTDALVIDQLNNPGGNLFYMYALASMLTDRPLQVPVESVTLTQEDIYFAVANLEDVEEIETDEQAKEEIGETLYGLHVDLQLAQELTSYFKFIISEWNEGRTRTNNTAFFGISHIKPNPKVHYSKPILFLVNSLDFSCGDFTPAILQDNKRATIMGSRTAGAGGFILAHSFPNLFGLAGFSYTGSIAERIDHNPIENLGVTPDIPYEITTQDIEQNYVPYVRAINTQISKMISK